MTTRYRIALVIGLLLLFSTAFVHAANYASVLATYQNKTVKVFLPGATQGIDMTVMKVDIDHIELQYTADKVSNKYYVQFSAISFVRVFKHIQATQSTTQIYIR